MTMPTHPFFGVRLTVARIERDQGGRRFILVQHPRDGFLRLPIGWTDRAAATIPPRVDGRDLQVDVLGLLKLTHACAAWSPDGLDICISKRTLDQLSQERIRPMDGPTRDTLVDSRGRAEAGGGPSLGDVGAQAAAKQKGGGGA